MSTFLELCQQFHREVGMSGTISTVTGQSGMIARMIAWIVKADRKIQTRKTNWNFLWSEYEITLTAEGEYAAPENLGQFDQGSFWVAAGSVEAYPLTYVKHKEWRDGFRHSMVDAASPSLVTIKPNGKLMIIPSPDSDSQGKVVTCDYWKTPVPLASNTQVSLIPAQFHDIIVAQAKVYHAEYRHDNGAYQAAMLEHETLYRELKSHSLPGNQEDNKSESSIPMTITVE